MACSKCRFKTDVPRPEKSQWGPLLWTILHSLSLQNQKQSDTYRLKELKQRWKFIYDTLPFIIPCLECRDHCSEYLKENQPTDWNLIQTEKQLSDLNTLWFYKFHNSVNIRLLKPLFSQDDIQKTYSIVNISTTFSIHVKCMELSVSASDISFITWNKWRTNMAILISLYAV
jgi:hypothetical protein